MIYPQWVDDYVYKQFSSSSVMQEDGLSWINDAKKWMKFFLMDLGVNTKDRGEFVFKQCHYYWFCFFKLRGRWFYCNSGDVRFKVCGWMLFRTAEGPNDYTGGRNQQIVYDQNFVGHFLKEIRVHFPEL